MSLVLGFQNVIMMFPSVGFSFFMVAKKSCKSVDHILISAFLGDASFSEANFVIIFFL